MASFGRNNQPGVLVDSAIVSLRYKRLNEGDEVEIVIVQGLKTFQVSQVKKLSTEVEAIGSRNSN
ncbi:MAG TPA: hypothetical protein VKZ53_08970 [Candidatus Angelobacter sp.]|nr:hypothetical protein [Candidatus Angelobacter sp.]